MNMSAPLTNIRSFVSYQFSSLRMRALRDLVLAKMTGKSTKLPTIPEQARREHPNRSLLGVKDIPVEQIAGTINRDGDFDHKFRPLKKHLLNRWINIYIMLERDNWPPILVHNIGGKYYVEDGHHRVSVARSIGMAFIEARIWEYRAPQKQANAGLRIKCGERSTAKVYAAR
jgi:hypothetical protein